MEKLEFKAEVDVSSFRKSLDNVKLFARDTKKELDKTLYINLSVNVASLQSSLEKAKQELKKAKKVGDESATFNAQLKVNTLTSNLTEAKRKLQNFKNTGDESLSRLQKKFDQVSNSSWFLTWAISKIAPILWTAFAVWNIKEMSDKFIGIENTLRTVVWSGDLDTLRGKIVNLANDTRAPLEWTAKAFSRLDFANKQLGGAQQETIDIVSTLNKGLVISGATAEETASATLQLSQAFASWKLQWDEFRSLSENFPLFMDALAKSMWVPRGELKQLASEGKITSEVIKTALLWMKDDIDEKFWETQITVGQKLTQITNGFLVKFGEMDKKVSFTNWVVAGLEVIRQWFSFTADEVGNNIVPQLTFSVWEMFSSMFSLISDSISGIVSLLWLFSSEEDKFAENTESTYVRFLKWFNAIFLFITNWIKVLGFSIKELWAFFIEWFQFIAQNFSIFWWNMKAMASNIANNIGQWFYDFPAVVGNAMKEWIKPVIDFFNKVISKYNEFVWSIGADSLKINATLKAPTIDYSWIKGKYRSVDEWKREYTSFSSWFLERWWQFANELSDYNVKALANIESIGKERISAEWQLDKRSWSNLWNVKTTDWKWGSWKWSGWKSKAGNTEKEAQKEAEKKLKEIEEQAKKELEAQKKFIEDKAEADIKAVKQSKKTEEEKAKAIIDINTKAKESIDLLNGKYSDIEQKKAEKKLKEIEEQKKDEEKVLKEVLDWMQKIKEEYAKKEEESYKDLWNAQKQNINDVEKLATEYGKLWEEIKTVWEKWVEDIKSISDEIENLQKKLEEIGTKGKTDIATRGIEVQKDIKSLQEKQDKTPEEQQQLLELQKELLLIESNTTPEDRQKALIESQKSKTQLILDEIKASEEKTKLEIADAERRKKETEEKLALDIKSLTDKQTAIKTQLDLELLAIQEQDLAKRKIESEYTAYFGEEMKIRADMLADITARAREASIALQSAGISSQSLQAWTGTISNNTSNISVVNNSQVDAESFLRALNNRLP